MMETHFINVCKVASIGFLHEGIWVVLFDLIVAWPNLSIMSSGFKILGNWMSASKHQTFYW